MTFTITDITWAVGHYFNLYVGLQGLGWPYVFGMPPRGDVWLKTPRARATDLGQGPHLCPGVPAGSPRAAEPREREKTRGRKRKNAEGPKTPIYTYMVVIYIIMSWHRFAIQWSIKVLVFCSPAFRIAVCTRLLFSPSNSWHVSIGLEPWSQ